MARLLLAGAAVLLLGGAGSCGRQMVSSGVAAPRDARAEPIDAGPAPISFPGLPAPSAGDRDAAAGSATPCVGTDSVEPVSCAAIGVVLAAPYDSRYTCFDLGPVPGVITTKYGGLSLTADRCSATLIIGVNANAPGAKLYSVGVTRDTSGHVNGFSGTASVLIDAPFHDGGVAFGPGGVLFITRWPVNEIQQTKPGSAGVDKVTSLTPLGVPASASSLNFVPASLPGGGSLKLVTYSGGDWFTLLLSPDGLGTYDIVGAKRERRLQGGPEGFVYVAAGSPLIPAHSVLVSEWSARRISLYETDQNGNPKLDTSARLHHGAQRRRGRLPRSHDRRFFLLDLGSCQRGSGDRGPRFRPAHRLSPRRAGGIRGTCRCSGRPAGPRRTADRPPAPSPGTGTSPRPPRWPATRNTDEDRRRCPGRRHRAGPVRRRRRARAPGRADGMMMPMTSPDRSIGRIVTGGSRAAAAVHALGDRLPADQTVEGGDAGRPAGEVAAAASGGAGDPGLARAHLERRLAPIEQAPVVRGDVPLRAGGGRNRTVPAEARAQPTRVDRLRRGGVQGGRPVGCAQHRPAPRPGRRARPPRTRPAPPPRSQPRCRETKAAVSSPLWPHATIFGPGGGADGRPAVRFRPRSRWAARQRLRSPSQRRATL